MQKNARGYTEDATTALKQAVENLQAAIRTVEQDDNRNSLQESLHTVEMAYKQTSNTANVLGQK